MPSRPVALVAAALLGLGPAVLAVPAHAQPTHTRVIDGPDVASYQHPHGARIHWGAVARAGKDFAIVKTTEGTGYANPWFRRDYAGAHHAGLVRGSYHFARPAYPIVKTARSQARYYVAHLRGRIHTTRTLPPALDLEVTDGLGRAALVSWAQAFLLETRRLTGRTPFIYTYPSFWYGSLGDAPALSRYRLWMASYSSRPSVSSELWQYTSTARVRGIAGAVDMSRYLGDRTSWRRLSSGRQDLWPAAAPGAPQSVGVRWLGSGRASVTWLPGDAGSTDVTGYVVHSAPGVAAMHVPAGQFSVTLHGLTRGVTYPVRVRAVNAIGRGPAAAVNFLAPARGARLHIQDPAPIVYGSDGSVRVRLTRTSDRRALADRTLTVSTAPAGSGTWTAQNPVVTGRHGWARIPLALPDQSLDVQVSFTSTRFKTVPATTRLVVASAVTAAFDTAAPLANVPVVLSGTVAPALAGQTVKRQVLTSGGWQTEATTVTLVDGTYLFAFTPPSAATTQYRIVAAPIGTLAKGVSPVVTVTVPAPII